MARHSLRLIMVLGALITLLGSTGIFAVFTDRATGGNNSAVSGARASAADIHIATATFSSPNVVCGTFAENSTTPQFSLSNLQPSSTPSTSYVCIRNVGAAAITLRTFALGISDTDPQCTGDEAASGDATCGGGQAGELSPVLVAVVEALACSGGATISSGGVELADLDTLPVPVGPASVAPGQVVCVQLDIEYPTTTAETAIQIAQSDEVRWQYLFEATAP